MIDPVLPTYARAPMAFVSGEGVWLTDDQGRRFLDMGGGIAVNALGHANPDLVAPREEGLSFEPGLVAHEVTERTGQKAAFFGKPFGNAFDTALARLKDVPRHRIAMVGDTLHTDVLGGASAGIGTILITDHGLFRGHDVAPYISRSGIRPDWIVATT